MLKIGLDIHGVLDSGNHELFSQLTELLVSNGHEVHVITGAQVNEQLNKQLDNLGVRRTHIFSISDYHKSIGTPMYFQDANNPWMDEDVWNRTKAKYCKDNGIHLMLDDSPIYGIYFETPYALFTSGKNNE